jgi:protein-disulfide isomerase
LPLLEQVLGQYPNETKVVFKNYPLRNHKFAVKAATAALAAKRQGKFWEFHDQLFKNFNRLSDQKIEEIAKELGLKEEQFRADMKDPQMQAKISQDVRDGKSAGVTGVPTVFVNGKRLKQRSLQGFRAIIEKELAKTRSGDS